MSRKQIFNLKTEVLNIASAKFHKWKDGDFGENEDPYGKGDDEHYGHVKLVGSITEETNDNDGASVGAIKGYVSNALSSHFNITTQNTGNINNNSLLSASVIKDLINQAINGLTTKTINYQKNEEQPKPLNNVLDDITTAIENNINPNNVDLTSPKSIPENTDIDSLQTAGYYFYDKDETISLTYNDLNVHYKNSLITVEAQPNGNIIQYINATTPSGNELSDYKMTGEKYFRIFNGTNWSNLSLIYTPQKTKEVNITEALQTENSTGIITITETTAGFIVNWHQTSENNTYIIQEDLYEYETIGVFPPIPIGNNPYVFGNLIGKIDIKITKENIAVRSTLPSGSIIKNVNATFFVPRME